MTEVSGAYAQRLLMTLFLVSFGIYLFLATVTYTPFDPAGCIYRVIPCKSRMPVALLGRGLLTYCSVF